MLAYWILFNRMKHEHEAVVTGNIYIAHLNKTLFTRGCYLEKNITR